MSFWITKAVGPFETEQSAGESLKNILRPKDAVQYNLAVGRGGFSIIHASGSTPKYAIAAFD